MFKPTLLCSLLGSLTIAATAFAQNAAPAGTPGADPYPLDVCSVSGEKLGAMGDVVVKQYDGREVRFCCNGCVRKFEADPVTYTKKIDALIVKDQLRYYPTATCVVSGEPLVEDGEDIAINAVYGNRLVRLCCRGCERKLKADPKQFFAKLDKAIADAQRKDYPLDTCVVGGGALGSMGDPVEMVLAGRLLRFCCGGCAPKAKADPVKYLTAIDAAWLAKGRFKPAAVASEHDGHQHDHASHDGHGDHDH